MKIHSVKYNFIMNAILTVAGIIFPLITFPYISRVLLVEGSGKVAFATSVVTYFTMFASLGIPTYGVPGMCDCKRQQRKTLQDRSGTVDHQWEEQHF
ncbi:MAG: oligosaccharide flippase family protein [Mediterraneibacter gnavus]